MRPSDNGSHLSSIAPAEVFLTAPQTWRRPRELSVAADVYASGTIEDCGPLAVLERCFWPFTALRFRFIYSLRNSYSQYRIRRRT